VATVFASGEWEGAVEVFPLLFNLKGGMAWIRNSGISRN
jgi:hypothetical protein